MTGLQRGAFKRNHCNKCPEFKARFRVAEALHKLFGNSGSWDFDTCYRACVEKFFRTSQLQKDCYHKKQRQGVGA